MNNVRDEIARGLRLLIDRDQVFEARILKVRSNGKYTPPSWSGYFDGAHIDEAASAIAAFDGRGHAYITPNVVDPQLLARRKYQIRPLGKDEPTTADKDIIKRRFLLVDVDPTRPADIPSTNTQHDAAIALVREIVDTLVAEGWPRGIVADSGNGGHCEFRIDLPNDDDAGALVCRVTAKLAERFDRPGLKIDTTTTNAARVWKCYGVLAIKGDDSPELEMPHRRSRILDAPETLNVVPQALLEKLAGPATNQEQAKSKTTTTRSNRSFDVDRFVAAYLEPSGLIVGGPESYKNGRRWRMHCAFEADHRDCAYLCQLPSGAIDYKCQHNTCKHTRKWRELRAKFEPHRASAEIVITVDLEEMADQAERLLADPDSPTVFARNHRLVRIVRDDAHRRLAQLVRNTGTTPTIMGAEHNWIREQLSIRARWAKWVKARNGDESLVDVTPPHEIVNILTARAEWDEIPPLEGICEIPILRPDGSVATEPGYDVETGVYFAPEDVDFPEVPAEPDQHDARKALERLVGPLAEFPFVDPSDKSVAISGILSLVGRSAIRGPVPLHAMRAPAPGTGKDKLINVASIIATGREAPATAPPVKGEEWSKLILALAIEGAQLVLVDNVIGNLGCAPLDMAITQNVVKDRILGVTETATAGIRAVWFASGNNMAFTKELTRRVLPCNLDSGLEHPEDRDFKIRDLEGWVRTHRPALVVDALTILRAYFVAGCPGHGLTPMANFEAWDGIVRGALLWLDQADPIAGCKRIREDGTDLDVAAHRAGVRALLSETKGDWFNASTLATMAKERAADRYSPDGTLLGALVEFCRCNEREFDGRRLGCALRSVKDRVLTLDLARYAIRYQSGDFGRWRLETVEILDVH